MVDLALKILLDDKARFLITVSGVGFAVALVFVQVGLFLGLLDNASVTIERMDADLWVTARHTPNVDFGNTFPETLARRVRSVTGVARARARGVARAAHLHRRQARQWPRRGRRPPRGSPPVAVQRRPHPRRVGP